MCRALRLHTGHSSQGRARPGIISSHTIKTGFPSTKRLGVRLARWLDEFYWLDKDDPHRSLRRMTQNRGEAVLTDGKYTLSSRAQREIGLALITGALGACREGCAQSHGGSNSALASGEREAIRGALGAHLPEMRLCGHPDQQHASGFLAAVRFLAERSRKCVKLYQFQSPRALQMPSEQQLMGWSVEPGAEMVAHGLNLAVERAGSIIARMLLDALSRNMALGRRAVSHAAIISCLR